MKGDALQLNMPKCWQAKINIFREQLDAYDCQIEANNDVEAVSVWLKRYEKKTTFNTYKKEAERFLLWCAYEKGLYLRELKVRDFEDYFQFLQKPPLAWIAHQRPGKKGRAVGEWRPFLGPLNKTSLMAAIRIIHSLMNFLVSADYLPRNPIKLIRKIPQFKQIEQERHINIRKRILESDEWEVIQEVISNLPEENEAELNDKLMVQFLFFLLYFLGLRIHEVANHTWNAFVQFEGKWSFFVHGKGDKTAELEVHEQLLAIVKIYRLHLNKLSLPSPHDHEHLLISRKTKKPLKIRQLFGIVKNIGKLAADKFPDDPSKAQKLKSLSPHWIRHKLASDLAKTGSNATEIRDILRHESLQTSQIYMHTEKEKRIEALRKIELKVKPSIYVPKEEKTRTQLKISLKSQSLSEALELQSFILMVESFVFSSLSWVRQEPMGSIMDAFQKANAVKGSMDVFYDINERLDKEQVLKIKRAIQREAEIRLFNCNVSF